LRWQLKRSQKLSNRCLEAGGSATLGTRKCALEIARAPNAVGAVNANHLLLILLGLALQVGEDGIR
jgi:hypothetical protein